MRRVLSSSVLALLIALFTACDDGGGTGGAGGAGGGGGSNQGGANQGGGGGLPQCDGNFVYAEPGCETAPQGDATLPAAGCYEPCTQAGAACAAGTCTQVWTNPCICLPGQACCAACGGEQLLCLE